MNIKEAVSYCYRHQEEYIRDSGESASKAMRQFDCLIAILEDGTITPDELASYGMDYKD